MTIRRIRDWLSCFVPAVPWLITAVLIVAVLMILVSALRPKAHAQFGGVQQPMFGMQSVEQWTPETPGSLLIWVNPKSNYVFLDTGFATNVSSDGQAIRAISNYATTTLFNLTNASTTATPPQWYSSHNGNTNPCLYFQWQGYVLRNNISYTNSSAEQWVFAVVRCNGAGLGGVYHDWWCGQTGLRYGFANGVDAEIYIQGDTGFSGTFASAGDTVWQLITAKFKDLDFVVRTNGVQAGTLNTFGFNGFNGFALGGFWDSSVAYRGDIAELLHYGKAMTSNEVWQVETYLRDRHPFVYSGP